MPRNIPLLVSLSVFLIFGWGTPSAPAANHQLPLKRIMLFTGGVGYFEHVAVVDGNAELDLVVRLDQVDDVLKSIVVYDDKGSVGAISLPGREPLKQSFRDLPFGRQALNSPAALLNALQGARVTVVAHRKMQGRIIKVVAETVKLGDGRGTVTRHRASLLTAAGVQQFIVEEAETLQFDDPILRQQLNRALGDIAAHRVRDKRTLKIALKGKGRRTVRVAYVVAVPLWKASYRMTLDQESGKDKGRLHGWAVVENATGRDWTDVELSLVSGNQVTFRQALYTSYYVNRPYVPVEVLGRILPRPDTGIVGGEVAKRRAKSEFRSRRQAKSFRSGRRSKAPKPTPGASMIGSMADVAKEMDRRRPAAPARMAPPAAIAQTTESATQVLFRVPVALSVKSGDSLVIPIIDRAVPAKRLALYQPGTHASHPLAAVRLTNDGASGLPPGVLTIFERDAKSGAVSYVGDAQLRTLPAGEKRLVSFALDQKTQIDRKIERTRTVIKGSINRGVFHRTIERRQITTYRLKAPAREPRTLLIEHPRRAGWKLTNPGKGEVEITKDHYRIEVGLGKAEKKVITVTLARPLAETMKISTLSLARIAVFAREAGLSRAVRQAFARMAKMMREIDGHKQRLAKLEKDHKSIVRDQSRIRENMRRVPNRSNIYKRYLEKLNAQENRLEGLMDNIDKAQARRRAAEDALSAFVAKLDL
ncbi:MAG: DUF4139 domain-containing protein [Alphaproteobacteria bacterium]